jgi:hypothetical protein
MYVKLTTPVYYKSNPNISPKLIKLVTNCNRHQTICYQTVSEKTQFSFWEADILLSYYKNCQVF